MWGIYLPNNTWFTGEHYKLETDENLIALDPGSYDDYNYEITPTPFQYKQYVDSKGIVYPIKGLRGNKVTYTIELNGDLYGFNLKDKIKLMNEDKLLKITNIEIIQQTHKTMATKVLPGLYNEYNNSRMVLTLE